MKNCHECGKPSAYAAIPPRYLCDACCIPTYPRIMGTYFLDRSNKRGHTELEHFAFVGTVRQLMQRGNFENAANIYRENGTGNYVIAAFSGGHMARSNDGLPELEQIALLCIAAGF